MPNLHIQGVRVAKLKHDDKVVSCFKSLLYPLYVEVFQLCKHLQILHLCIKDLLHDIQIPVISIAYKPDSLLLSIVILFQHFQFYILGEESVSVDEGLGTG